MYDARCGRGGCWQRDDAKLTPGGWRGVSFEWIRTPFFKTKNQGTTEISVAKAPRSARMMQLSVQGGCVRSHHTCCFDGSDHTASHAVPSCTHRVTEVTQVPSLHGHHTRTRTHVCHAQFSCLHIFFQRKTGRQRVLFLRRHGHILVLKPNLEDRSTCVIILLTIPKRTTKRKTQAERHKLRERRTVIPKKGIVSLGAKPTYLP